MVNELSNGETLLIAVKEKFYHQHFVERFSDK